MTIGAHPMQYILALIAGILVLIMPRLLNYIVVICLIVIGIIGLVAPSRRVAMIETQSVPRKA
jgi:hypothetical protein